ncbi:MAG: hypothetical protein P8100_06160 [bacterium]|jgi:hypothetical protein
MKTQRTYTAVTLLLTLLFVVSLQASTGVRNESYYLGENPPESLSAADRAAAALSVDFYFEEEEYINDIPFDTKCISTQCKYRKAMAVEYEMEEEGYVDDIPFNTEKISEECLMQKAMEVVYKLSEESYVDDIPFDTYAISKMSLYKESMAQK